MDLGEIGTHRPSPFGAFQLLTELSRSEDANCYLIQKSPEQVRIDRDETIGAGGECQRHQVVLP